MEQREIIGAILAPLAAPVVFVLQGGFGVVKLSDVFGIGGGANMFGICGAVVGGLFWVIARPAKSTLNK